MNSLGKLEETVIVDIPTGLWQIVSPSGEVMSALRAIIVPSATGVKTAYPIP